MTGASRAGRISRRRQHDADELERSLGRLPRPVGNPAVIVMIGLPGSGKSHFARQLASRYPAVILDSDALRSVLFRLPEHTESEHRRLFPAMHVLIDGLLGRGIAVIVDATNLKESNRKPYHAIARKHGTKVLLIRTWAPIATVKERLYARASGRDTDDRSSATLVVFERMRGEAERVTRRHISVNTAKPVSPVLDRITEFLRS